jgi:Zn-dependent peptidase ImmA (M78 family)/DNA-binding XRE family transcriptional regulator
MSTIVRAKLNNPAVLRWARENAGYDVHRMAQLMGKGPETIEAWETGEARPTIRQLRKFAHKVHRPLAALYLPEVPDDAQLPRDYRMVPGAERGEFTPEALLAFRQLSNSLSYLRGLVADLGEPLSLDLPHWLDTGESPPTRAAELRETIGVSFPEQVGWSNNYEALREWRSALFDRGVVVQAFPVPVEDVRGFSMIEHGLSGIGLSSKDAVLGRVFSLFHEVAHVCLRQPGASGILTGPDCADDVAQLERYCDKFAAAFLLPAREPEVEAAVTALQGEFTISRASSLAHRLKVSKYVLARRVLDTGLISSSDYWQHIDAWRSADAANVRSGKGGNYYKNKVSGLGPRYVGKILQGVARNVITERDAARALGIRLGGLDRVREMAGSS